MCNKYYSLFMFLDNTDWLSKKKNSFKLEGLVLLLVYIYQSVKLKRYVICNKFC